MIDWRPAGRQPGPQRSNASSVEAAKGCLDFLVTGKFVAIRLGKTR
jgi:hypothetical protein